uniref:Uncharacterized protein n=1 Tax=Anguilla anguilla TaxID=7936 RepID=A0A0E9SRC9_ANGAN
MLLYTSEFIINNATCSSYTCPDHNTPPSCFTDEGVGAAWIL